MTSTVILAAGSGRRMGGKIKKELVLLNGKPVLNHSVEAFLASALFSYFVFVAREREISVIKEIFSDLPVPFQVVAGGPSRRESVLYGLRALLSTDTDRVFIHDGARPHIRPDDIRNIFRGLEHSGACIPVTSSVSAMKEIGPDQYIRQHLNRDITVAAQTPQAFLFPAILEAHEEADKTGRIYIDDSEIWNEFRGSVYTVAGSETNTKITYPHDLEQG
jgi:2-C-methyl-D-erythritol 4-phosphate cytidylyltransferase